MKFRILAAAAGIAVAAASLTACSSDATATTDTETGSNSDAYSIGFVAFDMSNATTIGIWNGVEETAKSKGWDATVIDTAGSADKAIAGIQTLVQKGVDVIFTGVYPTEALAAGLDAASSAGIPVASFGGGIGTGTQTDWSFGTAPGAETAEIVLDLTEGSGAILTLGYKPGVPCLTREAAFLEGIEGRSDFTIERQEIQFPGQVEMSTNFTQAWLAAHPQGSSDSYTVWACTDDAAVGAIAAIALAGRDDINVVSIDGNPQGLQAVQAGTMNATVWIDGYGTGAAAVNGLQELIDRGVDGEIVEGDAVFQVIDASNIESFLAEHPEALG